MARVTVEDCIREVPNRFELVIVAAQRTRQITAGAEITVKRGNDKFPVVALREIAEKTVDIDALRAAMVKGYRRHIELDDSEQEMANMLTQEQGMDKGSFEIGAQSFEEIISEEELARSFQEDLGAEANLAEEIIEDELEEDDDEDDSELPEDLEDEDDEK
jgi:DNA-directed RNA polymerase subunit omega